MLEEYTVPQLPNDAWLQQDDAPPHFGYTVCEFLDDASQTNVLGKAVLWHGHWIGGWVGPRAGLDAETRRKILCLSRGSNPVCPVRSQSLY
jgi:hypothetical protein